MSTFHTIALLVIALSAGMAATVTHAADSHDKALQEAQQQLNRQTLERRPLAADPMGVENYIRDAMKSKRQPRRSPPSYWRDGYTCDSTLHYSRQDYLDCMYYHRHHGHYW